MKKIICLHFLFLFTHFNINSQTNIKIPEFKPQLYDSIDRTYFNHWVSSCKYVNEIVFNPTKHHWVTVKDAYYNRFVDYYKMMPNDANDILYIFMDAIINDKDDFCYSYNQIMRSTDLKMNFHYKNQKPIMDKMCDCVFESYNHNIINKLKKMASDDQKYRNQEPTDWQKQKILDSINVIEALKIYDKYGLPDRRLVGVENEDIFFIIIQHSNLELMEKFLPIIKNSIDNRRLFPSYYAFLHDRINMIKGLPKEFGTQFQYDEVFKKNVMYKTINLEQVNINRKQYYLKPL